MDFKKPNDNMIWMTAALVFFGVISLFAGIRHPDFYMLLVGSLLLLFSCGIWFQSRNAAIGLMILLGFLVMLKVSGLIFVKFDWHRLIYAVFYGYAMLETYLWMRNPDWQNEPQESLPQTEIDDEIDCESEVEDVVPRIYEGVSTADESQYLAGLRRLSKGPRSVMATRIVLLEVNNGGFAQYFWNMEDEGFYDEALMGFVELGAEEHRRIFVNALKLITPFLELMHTMQGADDRYGKYKPLLQKEGVYDKLMELDGQFYDVRPSLTKLQAQYIHNHRDEFQNPSRKP